LSSKTEAMETERESLRKGRKSKAVSRRIPYLLGC